MRFLKQWFVIGSMVLLCACVSGRNLRKSRQFDFIFPDDLNRFNNRGQFGGGFPNRIPNQFPQPSRRPQQGFNQPQTRVPFPTPILPGPPANIDSPQESSTVMPDTRVTTPSPSFLACIGSCPTTSEYNPICGTNRQLYFNQQKFDCAIRCGAQVQVWRRGSCEGLFSMMRG